MKNWTWKNHYTSAKDEHQIYLKQESRHFNNFVIMTQLSRVIVSQHQRYNIKANLKKGRREDAGRDINLPFYFYNGANRCYLRFKYAVYRSITKPIA